MSSKSSNKAYVGFRNHVTQKELSELFKQITITERKEENYYFLREPHQVSGFKQGLPSADCLTPTGQLFNSESELRWKPQGNEYSVLLLTTKKLVEGFKSLPGEWEYEDRYAHLYKKNQDKTRFPKPFVGEVPKSKDSSMGQRYFKNKQTCTVHFVALTLKEPKLEERK
ncbi:hypothetical protein Pse7367_0432 [Thalassoporum mexicanum PCC 7367]|uniref:hypothetical protein n=1 Tax=Thalassoporum mexicanum TaxID=3457544 RepID=UPI00029FD62A|nr:hypothetical protein [Pseudanabaena sp. PCC 7367]AFY68743.1 hypothetical protein Pse7367_0432 [Pseudanabaena sp. PCC 7367]